MATLTNTKIKDTYDGLLKTTDNEALDVSGVTLIEDGLGNASALSVGRSGNGVTITGNLAVDTNTLYVDASNNRVGIGTSSPDTLIEASSAVGTSTSLLKLRNSSAAASNNIGLIDFEFDNSFSGQNVDVQIGAIKTNSGNEESAFVVKTTAGTGTPEERMRIDSSGNVTIRDGKKLILNRPDNAIDSELSTNSAGTLILNSRNGEGFDFQNGGTGAMLIDSSGNVLVGTDTVLAGAANRGNITINGTSNAILTFGKAGALQGYLYHDGNDMTVNSGSVGVRFEAGNSERMRIDSSGRVIVGGTTAYEANSATITGDGFIGLRRTSAYSLELRRDTTDGGVAAFQKNGTEVGSITVTNTSTAFNTSSDYRLKENVVPMEGALDRVDALKPSRFNFITDPEKTVDGFLAHEVQAIIPEAVTGEKDAVEEYEVTPAVLDEEGNVIEEAVMGTRPVYQGIDQSKIVPLLVGAIQELRAEIELLKSQLNA